jgi:hypothetical protein
MSVKVAPEYASIECVRNLCEPWLEIWGGDEWGESMRDLHGACHTSYGFSDEDCALFASKLFENLAAQKAWMDDEGKGYGLTTPEQNAEAAARCRELRDYWQKGGNLTDWEPAVKAANETLDTVPAWVFGEDA